MKTFLSLVLLSASLATYAQKAKVKDKAPVKTAKLNTQSAFKTDSVYITGHISNYDKFKDKANSVQVIINDLAFGAQMTYRGKVNNNGDYRLTFIKTGMQDVMLEYNEDIQGILVVPGHHMKIDFDAETFDDELVFSGDDAILNQEHEAYDKAIDAYNKTIYTGKGNNRFEAQTKSEKEAEPAGHKKYLTERFTRDSTFLADYIKQHKLSPAFVKWIKADMQYDYFEDLMRYTWLHPMYNKIKDQSFTIPDSYYSFVKQANLNNADAAVTSHFGGYLEEYGRMLTRKKFGNSYKMADKYEMLFKQAPGLVKDVMLSNSVYDMVESKNLDAIAPFMAQYKANVKQPQFKLNVVNAYNQAVDKLNNYNLPANALINDVPKTEADSIFSKILSKYAGKVVYVDFWATWCGPCRAEMPNSKTLHEKYAGKDVVFLYLGVQSEEKTWKAMIAELGIEGEHFLLGNNDFKAISAKFMISGIPRYILVDKHGRVFDDAAKRPGDADLKKDLEKLLATQ